VGELAPGPVEVLLLARGQPWIRVTVMELAHLKDYQMKRIALLTFLATSAFVPAAASGAPVAQPLMPPIAQGPAITASSDAITLTMAGQKSGAIAPITCIRLNHSIVSPRDARTGLPTGSRQHFPLVCTTRGLTQSVVILYNVLSTSENLKSAVFSIGGKDAGTIKLTMANIASLDMHTDANGLYFDIALTYQRIEWSSTKGAVSLDDWAARS